MNMEEIPQGHFGPVGEKQRQHCAGNSKIVQKAPDRLGLLQYIKGNQQNINAAKMEGQIPPIKLTQQEQHQVLRQLLQKNVCAQYLQHGFLLICRKPAIDCANGNAKNQARQKPDNMRSAIGWKAHALRNFLAGYKKHIHHPGRLYHISTNIAILAYFTVNCRYLSTIVDPFHRKRPCRPELLADRFHKKHLR